MKESSNFDFEEAKQFLIERERKRKEEDEKKRTDLLQKVILILKEEFNGSRVEVYLVGSITRPYHFSSHSDVDVVLKNYDRDRFDLWTKLEQKIGRKVEIIPFETCLFQEFVLQKGLKVI